MNYDKYLIEYCIKKTKRYKKRNKKYKIENSQYKVLVIFLILVLFFQNFIQYV